LDYLLIKAPSDSSERAFSSGGIVITKCCKGDIVEALEVLRSAIGNDILKSSEMPFYQLQLVLLEAEEAGARW